MPINIKNKRSAVEDKAPDPGVLAPGEIAVNYNSASPALYIEDSDGNVVKIAGEDVDLGVGNITGTTLDVTNTSGTDATLPEATTTTAGVMSAADKTKLDANPETPFWGRAGGTLSPTTSSDNVATNGNVNVNSGKVVLYNTGSVSAEASVAASGTDSYAEINANGLHSSNSKTSSALLWQGNLNGAETSSIKADGSITAGGITADGAVFNNEVYIEGTSSTTQRYLNFGDADDDTNYRATLRRDAWYLGESIQSIGDLTPANANIVLSMDGTIQSGTVTAGGNPTTGGANGTAIYASGGVVASSENFIFYGYKTGDASAKFAVENDGSATFAGDVFAGPAEAAVGTAVGSYLAATNGVLVTGNNSPVWRGYTAGGDGQPTSQIDDDGSAEFKGDVAIGDSSVTFTTKQQLIAALAPELRQVFADSIEAWLERPEPYAADDPETLPADLQLREAIIRATTAGKINLNSDGSGNYGNTITSGSLDFTGPYSYISPQGIGLNSDASTAQFLVQQSTGNVLIGGTVPADPNTTLAADGSATFAGDLAVSGDAIFGQSITIAGGNIVLSSNGYITATGFNAEPDSSTNSGLSVKAPGAGTAFYVDGTGTVRLGGSDVSDNPEIELNSGGSATFSNGVNSPSYGSTDNDDFYIAERYRQGAIGDARGAGYLRLTDTGGTQGEQQAFRITQNGNQPNDATIALQYDGSVISKAENAAFYSQGELASQGVAFRSRDNGVVAGDKYHFFADDKDGNNVITISTSGNIGTSGFISAEDVIVSNGTSDGTYCFEARLNDSTTAIIRADGSIQSGLFAPGLETGQGAYLDPNGGIGVQVPSDTAITTQTIYSQLGDDIKFYVTASGDVSAGNIISGGNPANGFAEGCSLSPTGQVTVAAENDGDNVFQALKVGDASATVVITAGGSITAATYNLESLTELP